MTVFCSIVGIIKSAMHSIGAARRQTFGSRNCQGDHESPEKKRCVLDELAIQNEEPCL
jgi:hypothetical protein